MLTSIDDNKLPNIRIRGLADNYFPTRLAKRFDREKANGTLPHDFPSLERARLLVDLR